MRKRVIDATKEIEHITKNIKEYFANCGRKESVAVIGISGGKDSTIAAALLVRALGPQRVICVMMPNGEQADLEDSYEVCRILGIPEGNQITYNIGPITQALYNTEIGIGEHTTGTVNWNIPAVTTNTPARIRMTVLYMIAAACNCGARVINTGNKSESYVGYTTKYGDLAGDYGILRGYYVREVLAIGDALPELPSRLVHKAPGDGMSGKTDEENMGFTYAELDAYLLDDATPDFDALRNIVERHERNLHKRDICIPHPSPCSRRYEDSVLKHGGVFEVTHSKEFEF